MPTAARISLALAICFFLALSAAIFAGAGVTHKRTVQEADFWKAAGCDELCLQQGGNATPRVTIDFSDLF
jgi:hypothetical protein